MQVDSVDNLPGTLRYLQIYFLQVGCGRLSLDQLFYWTAWIGSLWFFWYQLQGLLTHFIAVPQHCTWKSKLSYYGRLSLYIYIYYLIFPFKLHFHWRVFNIVESFKLFFWREKGNQKNITTRDCTRFHFDGNQLKDFPAIEGLKSLKEWGCPSDSLRIAAAGRGVVHRCDPKKGAGACLKCLHTKSNRFIITFWAVLGRFVLNIHLFFPQPWPSFQHPFFWRSRNVGNC